MPSLVQHRCLNHAAREAVARCPECRRYFCRECVTEHDGRAICSACLARLTQVAERKPLRLRWLTTPMAVALSLTVAWLFFYGVGRVLVKIPAEWHEGTVWEKLGTDG